MNANIRRLKGLDSFAKSAGNAAGHNKDFIMRLRLFALFQRRNRNHRRNGIVCIGNQQNRADVLMQVLHGLGMNTIKETRKKADDTPDFLKTR